MVISTWWEKNPRFYSPLTFSKETSGRLSLPHGNKLINHLSEILDGEMASSTVWWGDSNLKHQHNTPKTKYIFHIWITQNSLYRNLSESGYDVMKPQLPCSCCSKDAISKVIPIQSLTSASIPVRGGSGWLWPLCWDEVGLMRQWRPRCFRRRVFASSICPLLNIQPQPQSEVTSEPGKDSKFRRYVIQIRVSKSKWKASIQRRLAFST